MSYIPFEPDLAAWVSKYFSICRWEIPCTVLNYSVMNQELIPEKVAQCVHLLQENGGQPDLAVLSPAVVGGFTGDNWRLLAQSDTRISLWLGGSAIFADVKAMTFEGEGVNPYVVVLQGLMGG